MLGWEASDPERGLVHPLRSTCKEYFRLVVASLVIYDSLGRQRLVHGISRCTSESN